MHTMNGFGDNNKVWKDFKDKDCIALAKRSKKGFTILICIDKGKGIVLAKYNYNDIVYNSNQISDIRFHLQKEINKVIFKDDNKMKELEKWLFMEGI